MKLWNAELLLGTNLNNREENLKFARENIADKIGEIFFESKILETEPVGFTSEDLFLNQIIRIKTALGPVKLLKALKKIEKSMGRVYTEPKFGEKYCSRIIDLDILKFEQVKIWSDLLVLPHPQVEERPFVKEILCE
ncbi:2-amino-4-hydroxy-6-hydroxymethyldihydropteridinediphosphokinase [Candidatus Ornithobacterium hominis]|uniref:2-amino-4-hydroxy-6- hydroxymethyldihydropteridine diphosphokinase n=1 Tax=Candidatus Ornithobacterium hominis TaxID=2497989 RepID=UPI0024BBF44D|nr:2-amino-4-hydroxy-6-hydroxymethyldihydropteridine diphosphokinase [Candidatus Ornithobacterium hominis]CAI9428900.1 2-amino-4-hydroxy-6-hydroxymethyldihydropteridinediphosphokinase [Candidatus Ornithobacterium hominis]